MRAVLLLSLLVSLSAPAFAQTEDEFVWRRRLWFPLRDVNTAEYEPDFDWQRLSERERQTKSGIDFWMGSLSEQRLGVERRLQLNIPLVGETIRFRWQHEEIAVEEIEAGHEKMELQFRIAGSPFAATISGHGVLEKREASFGAGVLYAPGNRTSYVDLTVQHDAPVHDARTPYDAKDRQPPLRLLGEGNWERGPFRVYGFADWQLESRRVFETPRGSEGIRDHRRYTRRTELKAEWRPIQESLLGLRHRFSGQGDDRRHFVGYVDPEKDLLDYDFDRGHHRFDAFAQQRIGRNRVRVIAGWWVQDDRADFAIGPDYTYRRTQFLFGARAHRSVTENTEVGIGYWGNVMTAVRNTRPQPLPDRSRARPERHEGYYVDKADIVVGYRFNATARLELLLSQEVTRGEFGGGCGKALLFF